MSETERRGPGRPPLPPASATLAHDARHDGDMGRICMLASGMTVWSDINGSGAIRTGPIRVVSWRSTRCVYCRGKCGGMRCQTCCQ